MATMVQHDEHAASGPTPIRERYLAPDLARGAMLLFISLANSHIFLHGETMIRGYPLAGSGPDHAVAGLLTTLVDGRAYPMFAALFGYGMVQILRRQEETGLQWPESRKLLRRRGLWMIVFGFAHATLLFSGDIIGIYGLIAVLFVTLLYAEDTKLLRFAAVWMVVGSVFYGLSTIPAGSEQSMSMLYEDPLAGMAMRGGFFFALLIVGGLPVVCPFVLGVWAARRRLLDHPEQHLPLLRRIAAIGIGTAVVGGLPLALVISRVWPVESDIVIGLLGALHAATGMVGGLGYAAAIGLLAARLRTRPDGPGRIVTAVAACGQRSLTCYLSQSVVWFVVFAAFLLDLGGRLGAAWTAVLAVCTWVATVLLAELMRQVGARGPFELLLRRLTYGKSKTTP